MSKNYVVGITNKVLLISLYSVETKVSPCASNHMIAKMPICTSEKFFPEHFFKQRLLERQFNLNN